MVQKQCESQIFGTFTLSTYRFGDGAMDRPNKNVTLAWTQFFWESATSRRSWVEGLHLPTTVRERAVEAVQNRIPKSIVAESYGVSRLTVYRWLDRFERFGAEGLVRKPGSGRPRKLEELAEEELTAIVLQKASDFGFETDLWTVGRLLRVIREQL